MGSLLATTTVVVAELMGRERTTSCSYSSSSLQGRRSYDRATSSCFLLAKILALDNRPERKDPGPEQVGLGYRAVSGVEGEKGRNRSDVPLTQPRNEPEGTTAWGIPVSRRKAHFELWVIGQATFSVQGSRNKGPSTIQATKMEHMTMPPVFILWESSIEESAVVEINRAPFDLSEAESVGGYNVEYARDAILNSSLLAEANVLVMSLLDFSVEIQEKSILFLMEMEFCKFSPELEDHLKIFEHIRGFNVSIITSANTQDDTLPPWSGFFQKVEGESHIKPIEQGLALQLVYKQEVLVRIQFVTTTKPLIIEYLGTLAVRKGSSGKAYERVSFDSFYSGKEEA
uniref:Ribosomal protein L5, mitochondrial n=1 Tax=Tanacetum cinerariifolium TaxID=118510 RepID=A0A6L2KQS2_TANCI|nr:ribosomal protein L5, mitochondrial [Tanacetum cinerariifolium]